MLRVDFQGSSRRDLRNLPPEVRSEFGYILWLLQTNPEQAFRTGHIKKFPGKGGMARIRFRAWRLTYRIDAEAIWVIRVGLRENAYSGL